MKQYEDNPSAPKMTAMPAPALDKKLTSRIVELEQKVAAQESELTRMHRDIVRLRETINQVSARIK
jgi:hypothetical protein